MIYDIFNWGSFILGGGLITWVVLALVAPNLLGIIKSLFVSAEPLFKGLSEGIVYLVKVLWSGAKDIFDSFNTIVTVLLLCAVVFMYSKVDSVRVCSKPDHQAWMEKNIRPYYKFVKRTPEETQAYLERTNQTTKSWIPW